MDTSRKILLNLALRYRMAGRQHKLYYHAKGNGDKITLMALSVRHEAWNSYQSAKQIYHKDLNEHLSD